MALCKMLCHIHFGFNKIPRHLPFTKWFVQSFVQQSKQIHTSQTLNSIDPKSLGSLLDQGRRSVLKLKSKDNVSQNYELIYKASMELTLRTAYPVILISVVGMVGLLIYNAQKEEINTPKGLKARESVIVFLDPKKELWLYSVALSTFVLAAFAIIFRYPFRIYKHKTKREYIAMFLSPIPLMLKQVQLKSVFPTKFKNPLYLMVNNCHYLLDGKKKMFLMTQFFRTPKDLTDMYAKRNK